MAMTLSEFEKEFQTLGTNYKTKDVDRFNKRFIKEKIDVSFLRAALPERQDYYRTYFQVTIMQLETKEEKMKFIEDNFDLLHDWWHVDGIVSFLGDSLDFDYALQKAKEYIKSELPYVRRLGYVLFIPRLVRDADKIVPLFSLFKNDEEYHVVMGEAWLLSYLAMCDADRTYNYIKTCGLNYNIVGKAIQKICDSYVVSKEDKERFKSLRGKRKLREKKTLIRQAEEKDYDRIYQVVKAAFDSAEHADGNEQDLVNALRSGNAYIPELSIVFEVEGIIVGHIMFTKATVGDTEVVALAPLSVIPQYQRQGIGICLIEVGHIIAKELGYDYSVVLGSETYYPEFGYVPADTYGIVPPFDVPRENFMACKLNKKASAISGIMQYAKEFGIE